MVAPTDATVLILGESGTGKELVARSFTGAAAAAAARSSGSTARQSRESCTRASSLGTVKGAFTGAIKDRAGRFEAADGGTLLLDEVGEIPVTLQSKFLRVLQEKAI